MCGVVHLEHLKNRWNRDTMYQGGSLAAAACSCTHLDASSGNCKSNEPDTGNFWPCAFLFSLVGCKSAQVFLSGESLCLFYCWPCVIMLAGCMRPYLGLPMFKIQHCVGITLKVCWRCVVGVHDQVFGWNSKQAAIEAYHRVCVHLAGFALLTLFDYSRVLHFK